jgi:hypothetical protein
MPAALYSRSLFQALKGRTSWDQIFPTSAAAKQTASFWLDNIDRLNGRKWWPKVVALKVVVDASGVGFGGHMHVDQQRIPFTGTFTREEAQGSSTAREMRGYAAAITVVAQQFPQHMKGAAVVIEGDNQGAIAALNSFRSPVAEINEILQGMFELCAEFQTDVIGNWIPRESLPEADALSREPDATDWGISADLFDQACAIFGCQPSLDMFASDRHHTVTKFVSQFYTPGCSAVNALRLDWSELAEPNQVLWLFPPNQCVTSALSLLEKYKFEALVCMPSKPGSNELIQLEQLKGAHVSKPLSVPRLPSSCIPSPRVPNSTLNPAFLQLGIYHISWQL